MRRLALVAATTIAVVACGSTVACALPAGCAQTVNRTRAQMCDNKMTHQGVAKPQNQSMGKPLNQGVSKTPPAAKVTPSRPAR